MTRLVIVEDDPNVGAELAAELEILGYKVDWVRDAEAGAPAAIGGVPSPQIVVLDYFLPKGDGIELTRAWKSQPSPPVVVLVAGADISLEIQRRLPEGHRPDRIFAKPIGLTAVAKELCELAPPPRATASDPQNPRGATKSGRKTPIEQRTFALADIIWQLARSRRTGVLEIAASDSTALIHFLNGDPVLVESSNLDETLGRLMLRNGDLTHEQYQQVLRRVTDDLISGEDVRFGEIVVEMGLASAERVVAALRTQVREKLVNLFHRTHFETTFREGRDPLAVGTAFRVDAAEVILQGIRRHCGPEQLEATLALYHNKYAALALSFDLQRERFRFSAIEQRFLAQLRGDRTVRAMIEGGILDSIHAMQVTYALLVVDGLDLADQPIPRPSPRLPAGADAGKETPARNLAREEVLSRHLRLSGRSHYEVLDLRPDANAAEIEASYQQLAGRFSPEQLVALSLGDAYERATEVWAQIDLAYRTLLDPVRRTGYDEALRYKTKSPSSPPARRYLRSDQFAAEAAFQRGLAELSSGRTIEASIDFARARALAPAEPEYSCYEIWASCLQAIDSGAAPKTTAEAARARMEATLVGRRPRPRALYALALVCQAMDDSKTAREHLRAALAFDPSFVEAKKLSETLTANPTEADGKGIPG
ncbi:MAG: DUF4388 domain-containing protein [Pseudomonadota bacterium]